MSETITIPSTPATLSTLLKNWRTNTSTPHIPTPTLGRHLSPAEITAFLLATSIDEDRHAAMLLACVLLSGIPVAELRTAEWEYFTAETGEIDLCSPLTDSYQTFRLNAPTLDLIRQQVEDSYGMWVFHDLGQVLKFEDLNAALYRICTNANIRALTIDDLQRTHDYIAIGIGLCEAIGPVHLSSTSRQSSTPGTITDDESGQIYLVAA